MTAAPSKNPFPIALPASFDINHQAKVRPSLHCPAQARATTAPDRELTSAWCVADLASPSGGAVEWPDADLHARGVPAVHL